MPSLAPLASSDIELGRDGISAISALVQLDVEKEVWPVSAAGTGVEGRCGSTSIKCVCEKILATIFRVRRKLKSFSRLKEDISIRALDVDGIDGVGEAKR